VPHCPGLVCIGLSSCFFVVVTMLLNRGRMVEHSRARKALAEADSSFTADALLSDTAYWSCRSGKRHATIVVMDKWLQHLLQGRDAAQESNVISVNRLPSKDCPKTGKFEIASFAMQTVTCDFQIEHISRGAGGRITTDDKEWPAVHKLGPDSWQVKAQVC